MKTKLEFAKFTRNEDNSGGKIRLLHPGGKLIIDLSLDQVREFTDIRSNAFGSSELTNSLEEYLLHKDVTVTSIVICKSPPSLICVLTSDVPPIGVQADIKGNAADAFLLYLRLNKSKKLSLEYVN